MYDQHPKRIKKQWLSSCTLVLVMLALCLYGPMPPVQAQSDGVLAIVKISPTEVRWVPQTTAYDSLVMTIAGPDDLFSRQEFPMGTSPNFKAADASGAPHPDGTYTYELQAVPTIDAETQALLTAAREAGESDTLVAELQQSGDLPERALKQSGYFSIQDGRFVLPSHAEEEGDASTALRSQDDGEVSALDVLHYDDVITTGSLCVGFDCQNGESFGFNTIVLKENNLRLAFNDTSVGSFPTRNWRISVNDSTSGGASYFAVEDVDGGKRPFSIEAGAPSHSLYVEDYGRVGLGTNTPVVEMHIKDDDTPTVRLEQDSSGGWTAQTWDIAGNETNFFIRDASNDSKLPFRIQPGSPSSSLSLKSDGNIGLGTWSPAYPVELETTGENAIFAADRTDGATGKLAALATKVQIGAISNHDVEFVVHDETVMTLDASGNLTLNGAVIESSDVNVKENFTDVDGEEILASVAALPITTWNYHADDDAVRHMGPMAQDFHAAFGLGADERHIAPLDTNGVALAAIQALYNTTQAQDAQITQLEQQNSQLAAQNVDLALRVSTLETLVAEMLQAQAE